MDEFKEYGIEYSWRDGKYSMSVWATSPEEAMERIKAAANWGKCYTPHGIAMKIPVPKPLHWLTRWLHGARE
ncbi:MAG: hypothetical protein AB7F35_29765 [Acetobacteraceae bacterium]